MLRTSIIFYWNYPVREHFQALNGWLFKMFPDQYELIWVEVYDVLFPKPLNMRNVVIICQQKGMYHKHKAYNIGLLNARGS